MRVIISLYIQLIFLFVDGAVSSAIYYNNKKLFRWLQCESDYFTLCFVDIFVCRWHCKQCHLLYNFFFANYSQMPHLLGLDR